MPRLTALRKNQQSKLRCSIEVLGVSIFERPLPLEEWMIARIIKFVMIGIFEPDLMKAIAD